VALEGLFTELPQEVLANVPAAFSDDDGLWVGTSGRARVLVASNDAEAEPPPTVDGLTDAAWEGRLGIAPGNGSFLAFVAAMILIDGEEATADWLDAIAANDPVRFDGNSPIVVAANEGSIDGGLVNHYYLLRLLAEQGEVSAENWFFAGGPGALVMPAGAGVVVGTDQEDDAVTFIEYLLSEESQSYFATQTFEYPLLAGVPEPGGLPALAEINAPVIKLSALAAVLDRATELVSEAGLL
jgi:iron(III) transport system substrate-binding protein